VRGVKPGQTRTPPPITPGGEPFIVEWCSMLNRPGTGAKSDAATSSTAQARCYEKRLSPASPWTHDLAAQTWGSESPRLDDQVLSKIAYTRSPTVPPGQTRYSVAISRSLEARSASHRGSGVVGTPNGENASTGAT
jgi:hypothetical protein